jgi:pimeloyl-ACP methyl ester carboxylesterase
MKAHNLAARRAIATIVFATCSSVAIQAQAADMLNVQVTGEGQPMILIPGLASSGEVWDSTVDHYKSHYQCIVVTLAGFAGKPAVPGPFLDSAEAALSGYIAEHHLKHVIVVGHSLGGDLALKLAEDHPEQVEKLVIVDSLPALGAVRNPQAQADELKESAAKIRDAMLQSDSATRQMQSQAAAASMVTDPKDAQRIAGWGAISDPATVANAMYDVMSTDLRPNLGNITAPTLVMGTWIAYKQYAPRAAIEATYTSQYANLKSVHLVTADTARHFIMYDDPTWMFAQMDAFLQP